MNNKKRFVGTFQTETEVISKIRELKATGILDDNVYVIAKDKDDLHMLRSRTDAEVKTPEDSLMDKFMNFLSGEDYIYNLLSDTGLSQAEKDRYTQEIHDGAMLLYVDEGEANTLRNDANSRYSQSDSTNDANLAEHTQTDALGMAGGLRSDRDNGSLQGNFDHTADAHTNTVNTEQLRNAGGLNRTIEEVPETMELHEEQLNMDKQYVQTGEVTVEKNVVEEHKSMDIPVEHGEITIERRPVHDALSNRNEENFQGSTAFGEETIRVPVTEERIEVTKKPVVTEEIVINKKRVTETEHVDETLKREEVEVNREGVTDDVTFKSDLTNTNPNRTDKF
ncbi:YsnF/AvaK domain-containing protein [Sporosarcina sp. A2]|uniref:YsnF/AvaK domain-containing protein n=1 Tax=Sporosarcina sp. A2 TaxID=3393449 RepID=UPI003D798ECF